MKHLKHFFTLACSVLFMLALATPSTAQLVAHYKMDDNAANTTVVDSSPNGLDGTMTVNTSRHPSNPLILSPTAERPRSAACWAGPLLWSTTAFNVGIPVLRSHAEETWSISPSHVALGLALVIRHPSLG